MANKRIYQLSDAIATTGRYLPVDKSGNAEAERILLSSILPTSIYRCNNATVNAGETTISFLEAFPIGTAYAIMPIWGWSDDYGNLAANPYDQTVSGFKINFEFPVTFTYLAIIIR